MFGKRAFITKQRLVEYISTVTDKYDDRDTITRGVLYPVSLEVCKGGHGRRKLRLCPPLCTSQWAGEPKYQVVSLCGDRVESLHHSALSHER
jgi:hypothetical protein